MQIIRIVHIYKTVGQDRENVQDRSCLLDMHNYIFVHIYSPSENKLPSAAALRAPPLSPAAPFGPASG